MEMISFPEKNPPKYHEKMLSFRVKSGKNHEKIMKFYSKILGGTLLKRERILGVYPHFRTLKMAVFRVF